MAAPECLSVVCVAGSMRFTGERLAAIRAETAAGRVVVTTPDIEAELAGMTPAERGQALKQFAEMHRILIDQSDELLVVNPGGYIGESASGEIQYARESGKAIRYTEPDPIWAAELEAGQEENSKHDRSPAFE